MKKKKKKKNGNKKLKTYVFLPCCTKTESFLSSACDVKDILVTSKWNVWNNVKHAERAHDKSDTDNLQNK